MDKRPLVWLVVCCILLTLRPVVGKDNSTDFDELPDAVFVRTGVSTRLTCFPKDAEHDDFRFLQYDTFSWKDRKNQTVTDGRFHTQVDGVIKITDTQPRDSGTYFCEALNSKQKAINKEITKHHLIVYQLPKYYHKTILLYQLPDCKNKTIIDKQEGIMKAICPDRQSCLFTATSRCKKDMLETSEVLFVLRLYPPDKFTHATCETLSCIQDIVTDMLHNEYKIVEDYMNKQLGEAATKTDPKAAKLLDFDREKVECPAGYRLFGNVLCLPCPPGRFSKAGERVCQRCQVNYYQNHYASAGCVECPDEKVTQGNGTSSVEHCKKKGTKELTVGGLHLELTLDFLKTKKGGIPVGAIVAIVIIAIIIAVCTGVCCHIKRKYFDILKSEGLRSGKMQNSIRREYIDPDEMDDDILPAKNTSEIASLLEEGLGKPVRQSTMKRTMKKVTKSIKKTAAGEQVMKRLDKFSKSTKGQKEAEKRRISTIRRPRDPRKSEYDPRFRYVELNDTAYKDKRFSNQWSARMANDLTPANFMTFAEDDHSETSNESDDDQMLYFDFDIPLPFNDDILDMVQTVPSVENMKEETLHERWGNLMATNDPGINMNRLLVPEREIVGGRTGSQIGNDIFDETINMGDVLEEFGEEDGTKPAILRRADTAVFSDLPISKHTKLTTRTADQILNQKNDIPSTTSTAVYSDMPWLVGLNASAYMSPELEMKKSQASTALLSDTEFSPTRGRVKGSLSNRRATVMHKTSRLIAFRAKLGK